jgi:hypothetical protein
MAEMLELCALHLLAWAVAEFLAEAIGHQSSQATTNERWSCHHTIGEGYNRAQNALT